MSAAAEERPSAPAPRPTIHREVLPSASPHVSLALVLVPGPVYEIEPEPYLRISFNVGPSYSFDASGPGTHATFAMRHHALMVIPPGTVVAHSTATPRPTGRALKPARLATFRISTDLLADSAIALDLPPERAQLRHQVVPGDEVLRLLSQALYADLREGHPDGPRATEHLAMALVTRLLLREQGRAAGPAKGGLDKARAHIDAHLGDALSLEDLAAVAGISLFHFCRVFRESIGVTPHQYIVAQRMELACRLLWSARLQPRSGPALLDIALACGFNSQSHFAAQFRRHTGQTPRQWQRNLGDADSTD
jgi:AraC-like DNA-binding protein